MPVAGAVGVDAVTGACQWGAVGVYTVCDQMMATPLCGTCAPVFPDAQLLHSCVCGDIRDIISRGDSGELR